MSRYAIFLRGMNLGKRRITNQQLIGCFEDLGFSNVQAFLASGNIVLETRSAQSSMRKRIERGLAEALSYAVPTFVRSSKALTTVAHSVPFGRRKGPQPEGKLQVAFLNERPTNSATRALRGFESHGDWLSLGAQELFWWPRGGVSQSELDLDGLQQLLGPMTVRTHRTITRMVDKFF